MKNSCGKDECLGTCDKCMEKGFINLPGKECTSTEEEDKKEEVGKPIKIKLPKGKNTGVVSMFFGESREQRRAILKVRSRVRNNSPLTAHNVSGAKIILKNRKYFSFLKQLNQGKNVKLTEIPEKILSRVSI